MKKFFICLNFILVIFSFKNVFAYENPSEEAYISYYEYLNDLENILGKQVVTDEMVDKINYAYLNDLNQDGVDELIIKYNKKIKETIEYSNYSYWTDKSFTNIYTYKDGAIKLVSSNNTYYDSIFYGNDGKIYLSNDSILEDYKEQDSIIYEFNGEELVKLQTYSVSFINNFSETYYVNGHSVHIESQSGHYLYSLHLPASLGVNALSPGYYTEISKNRNDVVKYLNKYIGKGYKKLEDNDYNEVLNQLKQIYQELTKTSNWATEDVNNAIKDKIVPQKIQYKYQEPITREEFCELATQFYEVTTQNKIEGTVSFNDTNNLSVQKMGYLGVVSGVGQGNFDPKSTLTREQAATILYNLAKALENPLTEAESGFSDDNEISPWAKAKVGAVKQAGIMSGIGHNNFSPKSAYTREQSIVTILRMQKIQPNISSLKFSNKKLSTFVELFFENELIVEGPKNADKRCIFSSSNESVATIDPVTGVGEAVGVGKTTITATSKKGVQASYELTVTQPEKLFIENMPLTFTAYDIVKQYSVQAKITEIEKDAYGYVAVIEIDDPDYKDYLNYYIDYEILDLNGNVIYTKNEEDITTRYYSGGSKVNKFKINLYDFYFYPQFRMYYTLNIKNAKTEKENEYTDFEITLDDNYKNIIVTTYDSLTDKPTKYVTVDFEKIEYDLVGDRIYLIGVVENVDSLKNKPGKDKYEFNYVIEKNGKKVKDKVDSFLLRDDVKKGDEVKIPIYVNGLEKDEQYIIKLKTI